MSWKPSWSFYCFKTFTVSSDFTADEKMEIESIKSYRKDLLDDIQVKTQTNTCCSHSRTGVLYCLAAVAVQSN